MSIADFAEQKLQEGETFRRVLDTHTLESKHTGTSPNAPESCTNKLRRNLSFHNAENLEIAVAEQGEVSAGTCRGERRTSNNRTVLNGEKRKKKNGKAGIT